MSGVRIRPLLRRLSSLGRLLVALVVLVGVWLVAVRGVDYATQQAEDRRLEDRKELAQGYAELLRPWIERSRSEVAILASAVAQRSIARGIEAFLAEPRSFDEVIAVGQGDVVAATSGLPVTPNVPLRKCGDVDQRLHALVEATRAGARPVEVVAAPWGCDRLRVATGETVGPNVVVVLAPLDEGLALIGPTRVNPITLEVIDPSYNYKGDSARSEFINRARSEPATAAHYGGLVGAYASVGRGWGVTVEQAADTFEGDGVPGRPVIIGATVLAAALAVAFLLLAFFDRRRRKAHARAEDAKHAFFATVGHELRTPLTILRGYSDTLTARWDALSDDAKEMLVSNMAPAAQRMGSLVEKLLLASNIQAEAYIKPVPRPTAVPEVVHRVVDRWRPLAPLHTFTVDVDPLLPEAIADADALEQVLQQLVDNAVKYSPSGGRVMVSAMRGRRGVEVAVTDEGVGLPQNVGQIFEPLVQGEAVDTRVHDEGGAGVGLYIVRTLVRDMGGEVRAERREVEGSRFVVSLKAARSKTAPRSVTRV